MRGLFFSALLLAQAAAAAGTLEKCQNLENEAAAIQSCVKTEQQRAANQMRKLSAETRTLIHHKNQQDGSKTRLREYRVFEASHVRARSRRCHEKLPSLERSACEADMNYAHIEQLTRFSQ